MRVITLTSRSDFLALRPELVLDSKALGQFAKLLRHALSLKYNIDDQTAVGRKIDDLVRNLADGAVPQIPIKMTYSWLFTHDVYLHVNMDYTMIEFYCEVKRESFIVAEPVVSVELVGREGNVSSTLAVLKLCNKVADVALYLDAAFGKRFRLARDHNT